MKADDLSWATVAIIPTSGVWFNVYQQEDGTKELSRCPALLLQELRQTYRGDRWRDESPPYVTRVVFGDTGDFGEIDEASTVSNYIASHPAADIADMLK